MKTATPEAYQLLHDGCVTLAQVEENGIRIDVKRLEKTIAKVGRRVQKLEHALKEDDVYKMWRRRFGGKTNLGSRPQLGQILFDSKKQGGLGFKNEDRSGTGRYKVDEAVLGRIDHPFVKTFLEVMKLKKLEGTYLRGVLKHVEGEYLHPSFLLNTVQTFRSSSSDPNFQNMPIRDPEIGKLIRSCFIPRDGHHIVEIDYSGIEVRIAACYHKDPRMLEYITDPTKDMHRDMAAQCYKLKPEQVTKGIRYCNPAEAPIWMADGSFKKLGKVKIGDRLMGWERPGKGIRGKGKRGNKRNRKRLCVSVVTAIHRKVDKIVKVTLESGRVLRCTADHLWINGKLQFRGKDVYTKPEVGKILAHVVDPTPKIAKVNKVTAGWLAGIYDGEGCWPSICQSITHNPEVCAAIENAYDRLGFSYGVHQDGQGKNCLKYAVQNGLQGEVDFLNICKPIRKGPILNSLMSRSSFFHPDRIVSVEPDGEGEVLGLTTTTGNYVCWGYASKNCGKNMYVFPQFYGDYYIHCAKSMWNAVEDMHLETADGVPLRDHLNKVGLKRLGRCDPKEHHPRPGTFEHHIKEVENDFWNNRFRVYGAWKKKWYDAYLREGGFTTLTGFRIEGFYSRNDVINYPVQGSAFHCLLWSLIRLHRWLIKNRMRSKIVGQIHDSIVADVHASELSDFLAMAKRIMTVRLPKAWPWIIVPLEVEADVAPLGRSWFEKEKMEL